MHHWWRAGSLIPLSRFGAWRGKSWKASEIPSTRRMWTTVSKISTFVMVWTWRFLLNLTFRWRPESAKRTGRIRFQETGGPFKLRVRCQLQSRQQVSPLMLGRQDCSFMEYTDVYQPGDLQRAQLSVVGCGIRSLWILLCNSFPWSYSQTVELWPDLSPTCICRPSLGCRRKLIKRCTPTKDMDSSFYFDRLSSSIPTRNMW